MLNHGVGRIQALNGTSYATCDFYGNPVRTTATCGGGREPFAYVHLIASGGLNFDTIVFSQGNTGNFEFDNMAISRFVTPEERLISFPPDLRPGLDTQQATTCSPFVSSLDWTASNFASAPTFTITPSLPADFNFSANSGEFAGTPTATHPQTTYTVTATAGSQSKQATFSLTVTGSTPCPSPPSPFIVASNTPLITDTCGVYTSGLDWIASDFTATPTFAISPALPAAFTFNTATGEFSGTPVENLNPTTYTLTATNGSEQATGTFQFEVDVRNCATPAPIPNTGLPVPVLIGAGSAFVASGMVLTYAARRRSRSSRTGA
jgi:hypothetical protein